MAQLVSLGLALALGGALLVTSPNQARACSGISCIPGTFFPADGTVPANLQGIYWWPSFDWNERNEDGGAAPEDSDRIRLARVDGDEPELIDFTLQPIAREIADRAGYLLVPETPFVAGASYVAWDIGCASELSPTTPPPYRAPEPDFLYPFLIVEWSVARFDVTDAAPLPSELGEITVGDQEDGQVPIGVSTGECTESVDAVTREVALELSASARPWADALFYETGIDGDDYEPQGGAQVDPFPGVPLAGRAKELVYTRCDVEPDQRAIQPGTHRIELFAHVPGESAQLASNESRVTLTCPQPDAGSDASTGDDAGARDSGTVPPRDDGGRPDTERADGDDGCGCRAAGSGGPANALVVWTALLMVWRRRSRG